MSVLHFLSSTKAVIALIVAILAIILFLIIRRRTENPERKKTRQLLQEVEQKGYLIADMQADGKGVRAEYDVANWCLRQSRQPNSQAKAAFKQKRYIAAQQYAEEALRLIEAGLRAQFPEDTLKQ